MKIGGRRVLLAVGFIAICALAVLLAIRYRHTKPQPDITTNVFGNRTIRAVFADAPTATIQRLHWRKPQDVSYTDLGHYESDSALPVPPATLREIQRLFQKPDSFDWPDANTYSFKPCMPEYTVLLTLPSAPHHVQLALCLRCAVFGVYDGALPVNRLTDFDRMAPAIKALLQPLFPNDPDFLPRSQVPPGKALGL